MQKHNIIVKIPVPIYESSIILTYNHSNEELIEIIKNDPQYVRDKNKEDFIKYIEEYDKPFAGLYINNDYDHIIRIAEMDNQKDLINTVCHELMHYISNMLRFRGLLLSEETEEAYCYLQGYLMEEIYEKFIYNIINQ